VYQTHYNGPVVFYQEAFSEEGLLSACALSGLDRMEISVEGNADRILLLARFDNLGKGASGAAVQCLNLMTGQKETEGLSL
jgi:N-acetyl-gamma-glutamyl-phosphate reductase